MLVLQHGWSLGSAFDAKFLRHDDSGLPGSGRFRRLEAAFRSRPEDRQRTAPDRPLLPPRDAADARRDNVIRLPGAANDPAAAAPPADQWKDIAPPGSPIYAGIESIIRQEPGFDPRDFLGGAKAAYETIVTAFARGDRKMLKGLLAKEVYEGFEQAITDREKRGEKAESSFVSIDKADITAVEVKGKTAQVTIAFVSQLISVTRDAQGNVVDGSAEAVSEVNDIWTFSRQLGSRDPNWLLVATESAA